MRRLWFVPLFLAMTALIAAACGGGGDVSEGDFEALQSQVAALQTDVNAVQAEVEAAAEGAVRALMVASLPALSTGTFHTIDEQINNDGLIHATTPGIVQRAITTLEQDFWPDALDANIEQLHGLLSDLLEPVLDDDADAAGRPALLTHATIHAFEGAVTAFLGGEEIPAPPDLGSEAEHEHEAEEEGEHAEEEHDDDAS